MKYLLTCLALATLACGSSTTETDSGATEPPDWAVGWWHDGAEDTTDATGLILRQLEIRADGSFYQVVDYCRTPTWTDLSQWELTSDGALRVYPETESQPLRFLDFADVSSYLELRPGEDCSLLVHVGAGDPTPVVLTRGRRCMQSNCSPGDIDCVCTTEACDEGTTSCNE